MRNLNILSLVLCLMFFTACTERTSHGECIGAFDEKDPNKIYKVSGWNLAVGIIFFELVAPPVIVLVDETFCPIGNK